VVPILFRGVCLRDNKEDNEKRRKQDEKRLEIQCMLLFNHKHMFFFGLKFVLNKIIKKIIYDVFILI